MDLALFMIMAIASTVLGMIPFAGSAWIGIMIFVLVPIFGWVPIDVAGLSAFVFLGSMIITLVMSVTVVGLLLTIGNVMNCIVAAGYIVFYLFVQFEVIPTVLFITGLGTVTTAVITGLWCRFTSGTLAVKKTRCITVFGRKICSGRKK